MLPYIGRDHLHNNRFKENAKIHHSFDDYIPEEEYAKVLIKRDPKTTIKYLGKFLECARESDFDLNNF